MSIPQGIDFTQLIQSGFIAMTYVVLISIFTWFSFRLVLEALYWVEFGFDWHRPEFILKIDEFMDNFEYKIKDLFKLHRKEDYTDLDDFEDDFFEDLPDEARFEIEDGISDFPDPPTLEQLTSDINLAKEYLNFDSWSEEAKREFFGDDLLIDSESEDSDYQDEDPDDEEDDSDEEDPDDEEDD